VETTANIGDGLTTLTESFNGMMAGFTFERLPALAPAQNEKRAFPRGQNSLLVRTLQGKKMLEAISKDVSLSGIRLLLSDRLDTNEPIDLEVLLPYEEAQQYQNQKPLHLLGHVAWELQDGDNYSYGVEFNSPNEIQKKQIKKCFDFFNLNAEFV